MNIDRLYYFDEFKSFKDETYAELSFDISKIPDFGENELVIRSDSSEHVFLRQPWGFRSA